MVVVLVTVPFRTIVSLIRAVFGYDLIVRATAADAGTARIGLAVSARNTPLKKKRRVLSDDIEKSDPHLTVRM